MQKRVQLIAFPLMEIHSEDVYSHARGLSRKGSWGWPISWVRGAWRNSHNSHIRLINFHGLEDKPEMVVEDTADSIIALISSSAPEIQAELVLHGGEL